MYTVKSTIESRFGRFEYRWYDQRQTFDCGRCTRPKVSKSVVEQTEADGKKTLICNACFGELALCRAART